MSVLGRQGGNGRALLSDLRDGTTQKPVKQSRQNEWEECGGACRCHVCAPRGVTCRLALHALDDCHRGCLGPAARSSSRPTMPAPPVTLHALGASDLELLSNLMELYIHDLSAAFPNVTLGPDGRFG